MSKVTIDTSPDNPPAPKSGVPIWLVVVFLALSIGGFIYGALKNKELNKLRRQNFEKELLQFKPSLDSIEQFQEDNTITLRDIQEKQKELKKLEEALQTRDSSVMTLEEALKVIGGK